MIQEIYNYLFIRKSFLSNIAINIENLNESDVYNLATTILKTIQEESVFLTDRVVGTLHEFVTDCRSRFPHNSNIMSCVNEIIKVLNNDKLKNADDFNFELALWLDNEYRDRCLPRKLRTQETISKSIYNDLTLYMGLCTGDYEYVHVVEYLGLINLLINRQPSVYCYGTYLEKTMELCDKLVKYAGNRTELKYIKITVRNLKKLDKNMVSKVRQLKWELAK